MPMPCRHCGRKTSHTAGCTRRRRGRGRPPGVKFPDGKPVTLEKCRYYFENFGHTCLDPVQRLMFQFLLEREP